MALITLYVGNLPWETNELELKQIFSEFGEVHSVRIIMDAENNRSKGFGFIDMHAEAASQALSTINGARLRGRSLVVAQAKQREI